MQAKYHPRCSMSGGSARWQPNVQGLCTHAPQPVEREPLRTQLASARPQQNTNESIWHWHASCRRTSTASEKKRRQQEPSVTNLLSDLLVEASSRQLCTSFDVVQRVSRTCSRACSRTCPMAAMCTHVDMPVARIKRDDLISP